MNRRTMLAAPLAAPLLAASVAQAQAALVTEEFMIPAGDAGIELFLRNKRPENLTAFSPARTVLFVHGATYPAHTAFDLPLGGLSWMDYIAGQGFDVWCLDIRGYGRSTRPAEMSQPPEANPPLVRGDTAISDIASVAAFIRQKRNLPRIAHMGWSWGSALMGRFAADNPAQVERLVLFAPPWLRDGPSLAGGAATATLAEYPQPVHGMQQPHRQQPGEPEQAVLDQPFRVLVMRVVVEPAQLGALHAEEQALEAAPARAGRQIGADEGREVAQRDRALFAGELGGLQPPHHPLQPIVALDDPEIGDGEAAEQQQRRRQPRAVVQQHPEQHRHHQHRGEHQVAHARLAQHRRH